MIPLVDIHCHLLAGLDDGPPTLEEALAMCRAAYTDGIRWASALAHQNEQYPDNTPERLLGAAQSLAAALRQENIPLTVFPSAEVMVRPDLETAWDQGQLLSVAHRRQYVLLEYPHGLFVELGPLVAGLRQRNVRAIIAHAERQPELLHEPDLIEQLIEQGCLVQVSSGSITDPRSREDSRELKHWFQRGVVHLLGSDAHSTQRRPPHLAAAYEQVRRWVGGHMADQICSTNGLAVIQGLPLYVPVPLPRTRSWARLFW